MENRSSGSLSRFFMPALSGILLTAAFSGGFMSWVAWFALVPLLLSINGDSFKEAAKKGFAAGFAHSFTLFSWVVYTMHVYGFLPYYVCVPVLILLASYIALYTALSAGFASMFRNSTALSAIAFSLAWICADYLRGILFTGFPWGFAGYSQYQNLRMIQAADIGGVYAVTFAIVFFNGFLFWIIKTVWNYRNDFKNIPVKRIIPVISALSVLSAVYIYYGEYRLKTIQAETESSRKSEIAIIQGNIDQSVKWDPSFQIFTVEKYLKMSAQAAEKKPDFIVWPETAAPFYFLYDGFLTRMLIDSVKKGGFELVFGSPHVIMKKDRNNAEYYNSVYTLDSSAKVTGRYDKTHLVPFGEYTPLKDWIPFIGKMVPLEGDFSTGDKGRLLESGGLKLGTQICYEIIFPELSRIMVKNGADLIINVTNDAWFGMTGAPVQHFAISVFRAVENRRSLVRAANTGFSGFVEPTGRVTEITELFVDAVVSGKAPVLGERTFYTSHGDIFVGVCAAGLILLITYGVLTSRRG